MIDLSLIAFNCFAECKFYKRLAGQPPRRSISNKKIFWIPLGMMCEVHGTGLGRICYIAGHLSLGKILCNTFAPNSHTFTSNVYLHPLTSRQKRLARSWCAKHPRGSQGNGQKNKIKLKELATIFWLFLCHRICVCVYPSLLPTLSHFQQRLKIFAALLLYLYFSLFLLIDFPSWVDTEGKMCESKEF